MTGPTLDGGDSRTDPAQRPGPDTSTPASAVEQPETRRRPTRTGTLHAGLVIAAVLLVLLVVFLAQNARTVTVSFMGAEGHVSLAVALLAAALAGALIVGAASTARITQLRLRSRRARRGRSQ